MTYTGMLKYMYLYCIYMYIATDRAHTHMMYCNVPMIIVSHIVVEQCILYIVVICIYMYIYIQCGCTLCTRTCTLYIMYMYMYVQCTLHAMHSSTENRSKLRGISHV